MLLNKDPEHPYIVTVSIPGIALESSATRYDFGRANFSADSPWPSSSIRKSTIDAANVVFQGSSD